MNTHKVWGAGAVILASAAALTAPVALAAGRASSTGHASTADRASTVERASTADHASTASTVTVRIEGLDKTLLPVTTVKIPAGTLSFAGHHYSGATFLGALETATQGRATGTWGSYGAFVTTILGETASGTSTYWDILINGVPTSLGASSQPIKAGESLLVADVGAKETPADPIEISAPATTTANRPFALRVTYDDAAGHRVNLAGATVTLGSKLVRTSADGVARFTPTGAAALTIKAVKKGYIRDEVPLTVKAA